MSAYVNASQIYGLIPQPKVNDALDDNGDGQPDAGLLDQVIANAAARVEGQLASRYAVPFDAPYPAFVVLATLYFAVEEIYRRREVFGDKNPYAKETADIREQLRKIANRELPLDAGIDETAQANYGGPVYVPGRVGLFPQQTPTGPDANPAFNANPPISDSP